MKSRNLKLVMPVFMLLISLLSCDILATQRPVIPETAAPDITATAVYNMVLTLQTTLTAMASGSNANVPGAEASPTVEIIPPTYTPLPTYTPYPSQTPIPSNTSILPTLTNTPTASYVGLGMRPGTSVAAAYMHSPPVINGDLSEWGLGIYQMPGVVYGANNLVSEADLSANLMVGWDVNYLYIGSRIKDDIYVQISNGAYIYKGDSVEILLDTDVRTDFYYDVLSYDDYQLGVSPGNPSRGTNPEAYMWYPANVAGPRSQVQIGVLSTANGYHLELAIPWSVYGVSPYSGQHFGFAFSVSDNDSAGQAVQQSMISNVSTRMLTHPMTWGDLTLTD